MNDQLDAFCRLSDPLGRYYTKEHASRALVQLLEVNLPKHVIDLGSGDGALSNAARQHWKRAGLTTVDIERYPLVDKSSENENLHQHFLYDALSADLPDLIRKNSAIPDVGICNPPFIRTEWKSSFAEILEDVGLSGIYKNIKDTSVEVLFLAQNLRLIKPSGKIGIIVPDSIITGKKHAPLRKNLALNHCIDSIIKLPRSAFMRTEAQAYILTLTTQNTTTKGIRLYEILKGGALGTPTIISPDMAETRLDYDYHTVRKKSKGTNTTLSDLCESIYRGKISSSNRSDHKQQIFHTCNFPIKEQDKARFLIPKEFHLHANQFDSPDIARPGDILLGRVGRNLEQKVCLIHSGTTRVTDCVYIIRPKDKFRRQIFDSLNNGLAHEWLKSLAHGVGARQLPKMDLLRLPI